MRRIVISMFPFVIAILACTAYGQQDMSNTNNYLVTMTPAEAMEVVNCVAEARDGRVCRGYSQCLRLMPPSVEKGYRECRRAFTGSSWITCTNQGTSLPPLKTRRQVFSCINAFARQETAQDRFALSRMEMCMRRLYASGCVERPRSGGIY